jgi:hypothetical protein
LFKKFAPIHDRHLKIGDDQGYPDFPHYVKGGLPILRLETQKSLFFQKETKEFPTIFIIVHDQDGNMG